MKRLANKHFYCFQKGFLKMAENKISNKKGFHYGWVIVFVGFLSMWFITCIFSSAAGMFKSIVGLILVLGSNKIAKMAGESGIY